MRYAQQLYEGVEIGTGESVGLITYMRTDSVTIAKEAQIAAKEFIISEYGPEFAPEKFNYYKNKPPHRKRMKRSVRPMSAGLRNSWLPISIRSSSSSTP